MDIETPDLVDQGPFAFRKLKSGMGVIGEAAVGEIVLKQGLGVLQETGEFILGDIAEFGIIPQIAFD